MRRMVTDGIDVAGLTALVVGASLFTAWAGWLTAGAGLLFLGNSLGRRE